MYYTHVALFVEKYSEVTAYHHMCFSMLFVCCGALDLCTADLKCIIVKAVRHVLELALLLVCTSYHKYIFLIYLYKI